METVLFFVAFGALLIAADATLYFSHRERARIANPGPQPATLTVYVKADAGPALAELRRVEAAIDCVEERLGQVARAMRDISIAAEAAARAFNHLASETADLGWAEQFLTPEDADGDE